MSEKSSVLDHEFYSTLSFTHGGTRVNSGERFTPRQKRFNEADMDYLVSRGRVLDFTSRKNEVIELKAKQAEKDKANNINTDKPLLENPFKTTETPVFKDEINDDKPIEEKPIEKVKTLKEDKSVVDKETPKEEITKEDRATRRTFRKNRKNKIV
jgi:hypothetical protein